MIADSHSTATTATTAPNRAASNALTILRGIGFRYLLFAVSLAVAFACVVAHAATGEPKLLGLAVFSLLPMAVAWVRQDVRTS